MKPFNLDVKNLEFQKMPPILEEAICAIRYSDNPPDEIVSINNLQYLYLNPPLETTVSEAQFSNT